MGIEILKIIAVAGAVAVMIIGLCVINKRLKDKEQGFGPASLKAVGVVLFIPTILILAVITDFQTEALAALLGTVAGYTLSNNKPNE